MRALFAFRPLALASVVVVVAGCSVAQSDVCKQYVACQAAYDTAASTGPVPVEQYEADGICWQNAEAAATCTADCAAAMEANRGAAENAGLDVPSCR